MLNWTAKVTTNNFIINYYCWKQKVTLLLQKTHCKVYCEKVIQENCIIIIKKFFAKVIVKKFKKVALLLEKATCQMNIPNNIKLKL